MASSDDIDAHHIIFKTLNLRWIRRTNITFSHNIIKHFLMYENDVQEPLEKKNESIEHLFNIH